MVSNAKQFCLKALRLSAMLIFVKTDWFPERLHSRLGHKRKNDKNKATKLRPIPFITHSDNPNQRKSVHRYTYQKFFHLFMDFKHQIRYQILGSQHLLPFLQSLKYSQYPQCGTALAKAQKLTGYNKTIKDICKPFIGLVLCYLIILNPASR